MVLRLRGDMGGLRGGMGDLFATIFGGATGSEEARGSGDAPQPPPAEAVEAHPGQEPPTKRKKFDYAQIEEKRLQGLAKRAARRARNEAEAPSQSEEILGDVGIRGSAQPAPAAPAPDQFE